MWVATMIILQVIPILASIWTLIQPTIWLAGWLKSKVETRWPYLKSKLRTPYRLVHADQVAEWKLKEEALRLIVAQVDGLNRSSDGTQQRKVS